MLFLTNNSNFRIVVVAILAILIITSSITGFVRLPQLYYYGALLALGIMILLSGKDWRIGMPLIIWLLFFSALSILINDPPSYFKAWQRFFGFSISTIIVSPLFVSSCARDLRRLFFGLIMLICTALSTASFACYFLGINFFTISNEVLSIEAGRFSGLFNQSMVLGPIASLSSIYTFSLYFARNHRSVWLLAISVICFGSVLFSASRSALAGCIMGLSISYLRFFRGRLSRGFVVGLFVLAILVALFPFWGRWTEFVITKQQNNIEAGGMFMSREAIWLTRLAEIRRNPLTGVGFCCVDSGLTFVDTRTGIIEPGSSWLAVFSMTGVFGFIAFLFIFINSFRHSYALQERLESCIFSGCLAFFGVHLLFEGYVLAVGSFLGLMYWLLIGCIMTATN